MQIQCPNCGAECETECELIVGQHFICPFCSEKFAYDGVGQGSESSPQDGHAEERRSEEITAKCPHCGTLYEVEQRNLGQEATCETCGKNFVLVDVKTSGSDSGTEMTAQGSVEEGTEGKETVTPLAKVKTLVTTARNKTIIWWKNGKEGREAFCSNLKAIAVTKKNKTVRLWKSGTKGKAILGVGALLAFCICIVLPIMSYRNADAARVKGVQLWAGGPIWAEKNVGADKPEDAGLYFWWGDTIGYKCVDGKWVASDGSSSNFNFDLGNCLTYRKEMGQLYPSQDAAHKYLGGDWRMPTKEELESLLEYCDWKWTQVGGVGGYVVTGRDDFAAKSIFLPASGFGGGTKRHLFGERGFCGSSSPDSVYSDRAWCLIFDSGKRSISCNGRTYGFSVRPVQDVDDDVSTAAKSKVEKKGMEVAAKQKSSGDKDLSIDERIKAAENGDVGAQLNLALMYGLRNDNVTAAKWYRKAAEQGDASAQTMLAWMYVKGWGVAKNEIEIEKWFRKGAEQGYAAAQYGLGYCYKDGIGVEQNESEAIKWYRKAAEQGFANAQYELGNGYFDGEGITQDKAEAVRWFRKAAEQGHIESQSKLASCYFSGSGVTKDYVESVKWYQKMAEKGNAEAQYMVGLSYYGGIGRPKDHSRAATWFRKAAEQEYSEAQYKLGRMYFYGTGVARDEVTAIRWFRKAAEQGNAKAQYILGVSLVNGQGVEQDEVEALKWIRKAAEQGISEAQYVLGACYQNGIVADKNITEAVKWYRKAAAQGHEKAKTALLKLSDEL